MQQDGASSTRAVFVDSSGRRGRLVERIFWALSALMAAYIGIVILSLLGPPGLSRLTIPGLGPVLPGPAAAPLGDPTGGRRRPEAILPSPNRTATPTPRAPSPSSVFGTTSPSPSPRPSVTGRPSTLPTPSSTSGPSTGPAQTGGPSAVPSSTRTPPGQSSTGPSPRGSRATTPPRPTRSPR